MREQRCPRRADGALKVDRTPASIVLYQVVDHVGVITLNRPEALNAVDAAVATAVGGSLEAAAHDADVRVVVVTGSGRAFCAGADLKAVARGESIDARGHPEWGFAGLVRHWIDKPVIAAVNGITMGGGTEIVLACDIAIASADAQLGLPEVKRGLIAGGGGLVRLQRQLPLKVALEVALTGEPFDAHTAVAWGLLNKVVPAEELLPAALQLARRIADNAPVAVQQTKAAMHRNSSAGSDWFSGPVAEDPWAVNDAAFQLVFSTRDAVEGARAFAEKRNPRWEGR
jgi:crotonobetainyl-CoA hydratase